MARGDTIHYESDTTIANGGFLSLEPLAATQVTIQNVYFGGSVEFYWRNTDPATDREFLFDGPTEGAGVRGNLQYRVTPAHFIRVKNVSGSAIDISADGVQTK